jgi:hypothetical protein
VFVAACTVQSLVDVVAVLVFLSDQATGGIFFESSGHYVTENEISIPSSFLYGQIQISVLDSYEVHVNSQLKQDKQCTYKRSIEVCSRYYFCRGKAISITCSECMS